MKKLVSLLVPGLLILSGCEATQSHTRKVNAGGFRSTSVDTKNRYGDRDTVETVDIDSDTPGFGFNPYLGVPQNSAGFVSVVPHAVMPHGYQGVERMGSGMVVGVPTPIVMPQVPAEPAPSQKEMKAVVKKVVQHDKRLEKLEGQAEK